MGLFKPLEGCVAVFVSKGVYKQAELYSYNGYLFIKDGTGFIRVNGDGSTTKSSVVVNFLDTAGHKIGLDNLGRVVTEDYSGKILKQSPKLLQLTNGENNNDD